MAANLQALYEAKREAHKNLMALLPTNDKGEVEPETFLKADFQLEGDAKENYDKYMAKCRELDTYIEMAEGANAMTPEAKLDKTTSKVAAKIADRLGVSKDEAEHQERLKTEYQVLSLICPIESSDRQVQRAANLKRMEEIRNEVNEGTEADGGFTVPSETIESTLEIALREEDDFLSAISRQVANAGVTVKLPLFNDTANLAQGRAESADTPIGGDPVFSERDMPFVNITSGVLPVTHEFLQDTAITNIVPVLVDALGYRIVALKNQIYAEKANNTGQFAGVTGWMQDSNTGATASSQTDLALQDFADLFGSVKKRFRRNGMWAWHSSTISKVMTLGSQGMLYWLPGNVQGGIPPTFLGRPYIESDEIDVPAAGKNAVYFGDWRKCIERTVAGSLGFARYQDSNYDPKGQIALLVRERVAFRLWGHSGDQSPIRALTMAS